MSELIAAEFKFKQDNNETAAETLPEFEIEAGYKIIPKITDEGATVTKNQLKALIGKSAADLQNEWGSTEKEHIKFKAKYGIEWVEGSTDADLDALREASGLESKVVDITANVDAGGTHEKLVEAIESGSAEVKVKVTLDTEGADQSILNLLTGSANPGDGGQSPITFPEGSITPDIPETLPVESAPKLEYKGTDKIVLDIGEAPVEATVKGVTPVLPEGTTEYKLSTTIPQIKGEAIELAITPGTVGIGSDNITLTDKVSTTGTTDYISLSTDPDITAQLVGDGDDNTVDVGSITGDIAGTATNLIINSVSFTQLGEDADVEISDMIPEITGEATTLKITA